MKTLFELPQEEYHSSDDSFPKALFEPWGIYYWADILNCFPDLLNKYEGKVQLIYMDPPFMTGQFYKYRQRVGKKEYIDHIAYSDQWKEGKKEYLDFMVKVFKNAYKLLSPEGSFFLHVDYRTCAYLRVLLDDIFGEDNFLNEIIWHYKSGGRAKKHFSRKHDNILFFRKSKRHYFNIEAVGKARGNSKRNNMKKGLDEWGNIFWSIRSNGKEYRYYGDSKVFPSDVWDDISHLHQRDPERTGYDTQKPEALLERIILSSSKPGDLIVDFFAGSGTSLSVAKKHERRWVGIDSSPHSMHVCRKRLLSLHNKRDFVIYYGANKGIVNKEGANLDIYSIEDPKYKDSQKGKTLYTIENYEIPNSHKPIIVGGNNSTINGLEYIDYWAIGYMAGKTFVPMAWRKKESGQKYIEKTIRLSSLENINMLAQIVDISGNQYFYSL